MSTTRNGSVVIVGGGLAAARTAQALRSNGHEGRVTLLSEESEYPYDRPPLSKEALLTDGSAMPSVLLSAPDAESANIDVRLSHRVCGIDLATRSVRVENREPVSYESLVVATGTRARPLPVLQGIPGVEHLRTLADARSIKQRLKAGSTVTIIGAGFIGLEVASAARTLGCDVTIVEQAERPLHTPLGDTVSAWLQDWHSSRGVEFRCGSGVVSAEARGPRVEVELSDGDHLESDVIVVGVGVLRDLDWLATAGLRTHTGLVCDALGRASAPDVYGAGDVVCVHDEADGCRPIQHWTAAADSAQRVARSLMNLPLEVDVSEDYFWSNQAELRLMSVGHVPQGLDPEITSGDLASGKFVAQWDVDGEVAAVLGANSPKEFLRGRLDYRASAPTIA